MLPPLYPLLEEMQARPAMFTGELSLRSIRTFLEGYTMALVQHDLLPLDSKEGYNFHEWVAHKLGFKESTAGWQNMILAITLGLNPKTISWENYDLNVSKKQHQQSIQFFYELLEEFKNLHYPLS